VYDSESLSQLVETMAAQGFGTSMTKCKPYMLKKEEFEEGSYLANFNDDDDPK